MRLPTSAELGADLDIGETSEAAPDDGVAWRWIGLSGDLATETRQLDKIELEGGRLCVPVAGFGNELVQDSNLARWKHGRGTSEGGGYWTRNPPLKGSLVLAILQPHADLGKLRTDEDNADAASIEAYQLRNCYHGEWRPAYDRWVAMLAGQYASADGGIVRDAQARLSDMIQTRPMASYSG